MVAKGEETRERRRGDGVKCPSFISLSLAYAPSPSLPPVFLSRQPRLQMGLRGSRTSNGALFTPPPRTGTN